MHNETPDRLTNKRISEQTDGIESNRTNLPSRWVQKWCQNSESKFHDITPLKLQKSSEFLRQCPSFLLFYNLTLTLGPKNRNCVLSKFVGAETMVTRLWSKSRIERFLPVPVLMKIISWNLVAAIFLGVSQSITFNVRSLSLTNLHRTYGLPSSAANWLHIISACCSFAGNPKIELDNQSCH